MANKQLRIKQLCKQKGVTLEELAGRLGIRRTSLSQSMTRNSFSLDKLGEIADCLGVEIPDLFEADKITSNGISITCPNCGKTINLTISNS